MLTLLSGLKYKQIWLFAILTFSRKTELRNNILENQDAANRTVIPLQYNPTFIKKIKSIKSYRWHQDKRYCSVPNPNGTAEAFSMNKLEFENLKKYLSHKTYEKKKGKIFNCEFKKENVRNGRNQRLIGSLMISQSRQVGNFYYPQTVQYHL